MPTVPPFVLVQVYGIPRMGPTRAWVRCDMPVADAFALTAQKLIRDGLGSAGVLVVDEPGRVLGFNPISMVAIVVEAYTAPPEREILDDLAVELAELARRSFTYRETYPGGSDDAPECPDMTCVPSAQCVILFPSEGARAAAIRGQAQVGHAPSPLSA